MTALADGDEQTVAEPTLPPIADWPPAEPYPGAAPPAPVLAPYLGLVCAVLCALGGGWLLLAPYALDYRHGASTTPRTTEVDLGTGAAIVALAVVSAALFAVSMARRLRGPEAAAELDSGLGLEPEPEPAGYESEPYVQVNGTPEEAAPAPAPGSPADPGNALRELLAPLVTALAADLKSRADHRDEGARP